MNCPTCGSQTFEDQQFCRSCGKGLTESERRVIPPQFWGLMMAFVGLLIAMTGKMVDLRWLLFTGVFICIGGMFFIAALSLIWQSRPRKSKAVRLPQQELILPADTTSKLLPIAENDFVPSVVDATTNLLKTPAPNRSVPRD